jgi:2'-5' RNA ligase
MRLFVAADLPRPVRDRLAAIRMRARDLPLPIRWVRPEGIHLTFKFLGEVRPDRLAQVREALGPAVGGVPPFHLAAAGAGTFPERGQPHVVWVGIEGDLLTAGRLQAAIEAAVTAIDFAPEERPFRPHLTLGRVKGPPRGDWRSVLAAAAAGPPVDFEINDVVLFESRHSPAGATYFPLQRFDLAGVAA